MDESFLGERRNVAAAAAAATTTTTTTTTTTKPPTTTRPTNGGGAGAGASGGGGAGWGGWTQGANDYDDAAATYGRENDYAAGAGTLTPPKYRRSSASRRPSASSLESLEHDHDPRDELAAQDALPPVDAADVDVSFVAPVRLLRSSSTIARRGSQRLAQYISWQRAVAVEVGLYKVECG
jgi:hypothetical protein